MDGLLKIKLLRPGAKPPQRGSEGAAGYDVFACPEIGNFVAIGPGERRLVHLGFAASFPSTHYARVAPRSGLALKHGIQVMAGVIDPDYRGEWAAMLYNSGREPFHIKTGDKIAQVVFEKFAVWDGVEVVDGLEETQRGASGYGSTGDR